jgi:NAD(P)-dependent dehydrogenase (short-subunit alcohol dehydrogenase family)
MAGRVEGKVAFITGAARGQGRSHALTLAREGADIIAVDLAAQIDSVPYPMATPEDLADTVKEVEALDRRIVATQADVRDYDALKAAVDDGVLPTTVNTPMSHNDASYRLFRPDLENPTADDIAELAQAMNVLPIPWVEPVDISNALLFLASDEARYITGVALPVDAGATAK